MSGYLGPAVLGVLTAISALVVLGVCRAAARADRDAEKAEGRRFADQVEADLAAITHRHTDEEPTT